MYRRDRRINYHPENVREKPNRIGGSVLKRYSTGNGVWSLVCERIFVFGGRTETCGGG